MPVDKDKLAKTTGKQTQTDIADQGDQLRFKELWGGAQVGFDVWAVKKD